MAKKAKKVKAVVTTESVMGRPTLYDPDYCQQMLDYFSVPPYITKTHTTRDKYGNIRELTEEVATDCPNFSGFCAKIGIGRRTLYEWTSKHADFLRTYEKCKELQINWLIINGSKGLIEKTFGLFMAKYATGYRENAPPEKPEELKEAKVVHSDLEERKKILLGESND